MKMFKQIRLFRTMVRLRKSGLKLKLHKYTSKLYYPQENSILIKSVDDMQKQIDRVKNNQPCQK